VKEKLGKKNNPQVYLWKKTALEDPPSCSPRKSINLNFTEPLFSENVLF
jgi:hypothetical protein